MAPPKSQTPSPDEAPAPAAPPATEGAPAIDSEARSRHDQAQLIVRNHIIGVMGASLVPVPLVDLVALTGIQLKMLRSLAKHYDVAFSKNLGKNLILSLLGGILPTSAAMTVASFFKAIPGVGTLSGVASVSLLGGAATYAIGNVFIQHFESGGTLLDFDPEKMRKYFSSKLTEGKEVAANLKKEDKES